MNGGAICGQIAATEQINVVGFGDLQLGNFYSSVEKLFSDGASPRAVCL